MPYSYLALGDSYTIGEQVPIADSFPYQLVQQLRKKGIDIYAPEIIAKTGWTTDELAEGIRNTRFLEKYDWVTLLIGVNNQYRERSADDFVAEFKNLLKQALKFSGNRPERVIVISIPDWGLTPFAAGRDPIAISAAIDDYNNVCSSESLKEDILYIDITTSQRKDVNDHSYLAADLLHPSGKEYTKWAGKVAEIFFERLKVKP